MKKQIVRRRFVIEGIIIGVVITLIGAYIIDTDFRARIHYPLIKLARSLGNAQATYVSKNWTDIRVTKTGEGLFNVSATHISSGAFVTHENIELCNLPPDLGFASMDITMTMVRSPETDASDKE